MSTPTLPPGLAIQKADERIMTLNVGPQHPGSGHMRIIVQIEKKRWPSIEITF